MSGAQPQQFDPLAAEFDYHSIVENLVRQVSYYAVWVLGIIVAASAFGLEPSTLATGLGLTSLALAEREYEYEHEDEDDADVHGRRDSSVLFSLDELADGDGAVGSDEAALLTETSGLIDVKAAAAQELKANRNNDIFVSSGQPKPAATGFTAVAVPLVTRKKSKAPLVAVAAVAVGLAALLVIVLVAALVVLRPREPDAPADQPIQPVPVAMLEPV